MNIDVFFVKRTFELILTSVCCFVIFKNINYYEDGDGPGGTGGV